MSEQLSETGAVAQNVVERAVSFNVQGSEVCGIYSAPSNGTPKHAVVFTHGWSGNRNGPAGILTNTARILSSKGCACLRFDFRGRGESGGDGLKSTLATMSEDLLGAVALLKQLSGLKKIVLFGMCSGGNIAIGSLKQLPEAESMVMLSVYPFSDGDSFGRDMHRTWHFLNVYLHKALNVNTWMRLFKGEASLARVFKVIFRPFLKRGENKKHEEGDAAAKPPCAQKSQTVKASNNESRLANGKEAPKKYLTGLRKDLRGVMVYGTADPDAASALKYYGEYVEQEKLPIKFVRIDGANHNFSSAAWHGRIAEIASEFLEIN